MKKLFILVGVTLILTLAGCSTKYATVQGKDISVKVRSIWADVDYDSRVVKEATPLEPLNPLNEEGLEKLKELK